MKEAFVETEDGRFSCLCEGSAKPMILLHSLGNSSRSFRSVLPLLGKSYSACAVDMLGHGQSSKPKRDFTIPDHADSVARLAAALGISKAVVVGNSIGGVIALDLAARHRDLVEKLVLVGTPAWTTVAERQERYEMAKANMERPHVTTLEDLKLMYRNPTPEMVVQANEDRERAGEWRLRSFKALSEYEFERALPRIECPTLVIYGRKDMLLRNGGVHLYEIKNSTMQVMDDAGHLPQVDDPQIFCRIVTAFLSQDS